MATNTPPCPSPATTTTGEGVPAWKRWLGGRESWPRGLIDLFLVSKGIIWLSWGIRASSCWLSNGADSAQEGRRCGGCPCHPWDEETEQQSQKCCPSVLPDLSNRSLSSSTHPHPRFSFFFLVT